MHIRTENLTHNTLNCHVQYLKYKKRATIIGWLGEIISTLLLLLSAYFLHFRNEIIKILMTVNKDTEYDNFESVSNAAVAISSTSYVLSLVNILVCSMLLVGIARGCAALLLPWLLYHSLIFSAITYLAIYIIVCEIMLHVHCFALTVLTAIMISFVIAIFLKIVNDVLTLFKYMHNMEEQQISPHQLEQNERCGSEQKNVYEVLDINNYSCPI